jgi:hypothetical protein
MPAAHLADGRLVLVAVRKTSRLSFLRFLVLLASRGVLPGMLKHCVHVEYVTGVQVSSRQAGRQCSRDKTMMRMQLSLWSDGCWCR